MISMSVKDIQKSNNGSNYTSYYAIRM